MENENNIPAEESTPTSDAFLDGWNTDGAESPATAEAESPESNPEEHPESKVQDPTPEAAESKPDASAAPESSPSEKPDEQPPAPAPEAPKTWTLRHMDEQKTISADDAEVPVLLQKGMDYDRIREKYDAAKPVMELFSQSAKQANMTVDEYVAYIRTEAKKASGMGETEAKKAVELEDREAAISAKEAAETEKKSAEEKSKQADDTAEERRKADIAEFQKTFPDAAKDPKSIPQSVWDKVKSGERLTVAFALYQVEQAKHEVDSVKQESAAKVQNAKNEVRSSGSMKSAGEDSKLKDPFLEGWD